MQHSARRKVQGTDEPLNQRLAYLRGGVVQINTYCTYTYGTYQTSNFALKQSNDKGRQQTPDDQSTGK